MERLPLALLIQQALQRYRQHFPDLMRVLALPMLAHAVILFAWYPITQQDRVMVFLSGLAHALLMTLAAISCHRIILLGPESVPRLGASGTTSRDWRFIATAIALFIMVNLLLQPPAFAVFIPLALFAPEFAPPGSDMAMAVARLAALPAVYVVSRYAICLPAAAVDRPLAPKQAWQLTRGNGWRLLLLVGISPWVLHFMQRSFTSVFSANVDYVVAENLLFWLLLPLEIALLSLCYQRLSKAVA
ncbi:hypothetical protein JM946_01330 [Steroidobacter sp. S1-65]|uniref:Uncharacterized protein n=1 Tax=Steroidobacter gossypii TaxID=2805490 RepID=A0ABS1WQW3_9GAMM|nr:hypothetical protein [Steroidobacter gossypii]MBM0103361.1 hypothetical protein [Steroidobacter gossypii]